MPGLILCAIAAYVGYLNSVDWNDGMERWSGLLEWSTGLDYWSATLTILHNLSMYSSMVKIIMTVSSMVTSHAS